jgi:micrococcal nuclease
MLRAMMRTAFVVLSLTACGNREVPILVNDWCDTPREEQVLFVTDGDTLTLESGEEIRLLGIDAPEIYYAGHSECSSPESSTCCYGDEAQLELERLLSVTGRIRLEFDLACEGVYDRTLAYLFTVPESDEDTEIFLNEWLLEEGFAKVYDEDVGQARDIRYFERFQEAQAKAQSLEKGLWGTCF